MEFLFIKMDNITIAILHLLHWEFDDSSITPEVVEHTHSYWQMEICAEREIAFFNRDVTRTLRAGEGVLIAPVVISMNHPRGSYYSFKFTLDQIENPPAEPIFFESSLLTEWALENFLSRRKAMDILLEIGRERAILEALIFTLMRHAMRGKNAVPREPKLAARLRHWVANAGRQPTVASAAEYCGISVTQLKYRFACEVAAVRPALKTFSVKAFLDEALMELIDRNLEFTDLSLAEIARQLGFNNVYTFSRFCRRMTGMPPGVRRLQSRKTSAPPHPAGR